MITCWATVCASPGEGPVTSRLTSALVAGAVALIRPCSSSTLSCPLDGRTDLVEEARGGQQRGVVLGQRLVGVGRVRAPGIGVRDVDLENRLGLVGLGRGHDVDHGKRDHHHDRGDDDPLLAPEDRPDSLLVGWLELVHQRDLDAGHHRWRFGGPGNLRWRTPRSGSATGGGWPHDVGAAGALDIDRSPGGRSDAVIGDHEALDRRTGLVRRRHVDPGGGGAGDLVLAPVAGAGEFVVLEERDPDRSVGDPVVGVVLSR